MILDKETGKLRYTSTCLWEAMVHRANCEHKLDAKAYTELLRKLGASACMSYQEIGITPTDEGWIIHVNACNEDGQVRILIPKDRNISVQILEDSRKVSEPYERYENE